MSFEDRRVAIGMPVVCLAKLSGLHENTVRRILAGKHLEPGSKIRARTVLAIAEALGMELIMEAKE